MKYFHLIFTWILTSIITCNIYAAEKLIFAIDVIRHGDRTPIKNFPKINYQWPEGLGELTAVGMQQEFTLGSQKRKIYINQYHLLPPHYSPALMYVRSSDFDRTLMSAQSFLMGLYPPGTGPKLQGAKPALPYAFQPIPIHTAPKEVDNLLMPVGDRVEEKGYNQPTPRIEKILAELQPKFAAWSQAAGVPLEKPNQIKGLGDTLFIYKTHHIPLPKEFSVDDIEKIIHAGHIIMAENFKSPEVGKAFAQNLFVAITDYLQNAAQNKSELRYVLFSAHDSTLLSLMNRLGAPLDEPPHYASNLNFALFKNNHYYVRVTYNNKPVLIPQCGEINCPLEKFLKLH